MFALSFFRNPYMCFILSLKYCVTLKHNQKNGYTHKWKTMEINQNQKSTPKNETKQPNTTDVKPWPPPHTPT